MCFVVYYVFCWLIFYWIIKEERKGIGLDGSCFKLDYGFLYYDVYLFEEVVK